MTPSRLMLLALPVILSASLLAGCNRSQSQEANDLKAFKGENGKMPSDFKAKMEAAQRNGSQAAQQAQQQAAQRPPATTQSATP